MDDNLQVQVGAADRLGAKYLQSAGSFLQHELLFLLWGLMDVVILAPLAFSLMPWARYWPPGQATLWLLLILLVAFNLGRLVNMLEVPPNKQRIIVLVGILISTLLSWRILLYEPASILDFAWIGGIVGHFAESENPYWSRDIAIFFLIVGTWWRGLSLVDRRVDTGEAGLRLRAGTLIAAILVGGVAAPQLSFSATPFILIFFFAALASIALTRVEQLELDRSGKTFPLSLRWLVFVMGAAIFVVFVTSLFTSFISGTSIVEVYSGLNPLWTALRFLAAAVISTFSFVSLPILLLFGWLIDFLVGFFSPIVQTGLENLDITVPAPFATVSIDEAEEITKSANRTPEQLLTLLVMVVVVILVTLALGRLVRSARRTADYDRERVSPFNGIGRLNRPGLGRRLLQRVGFVRRWQAAASIRNIYRDMSQTAAAAGYPRIEHETPLEYLPTLARVWTENQTDTKLITEAFTRVRYGELPETEDELATLQEAWKRLQDVDLSQLSPVAPDNINSSDSPKR